MGCCESKKEFKTNFWNFCLFLAYFEQKVAKNMFLVIFSKMVIFDVLQQMMFLPLLAVQVCFLLSFSL